MRWDPINKQYNSEMNMPWHKWFAWYPVVVNNKRVWIKTIFRKGTRHHRSGLTNLIYLKKMSLTQKFRRCRLPRLCQEF